MRHPVIADLFNNILPYLGMETNYTEAEIEKYKLETLKMPDFIGKTKKEAKEMIKAYELGELYSQARGRHRNRTVSADR